MFESLMSVQSHTQTNFKPAEVDYDDERDKIQRIFALSPNEPQVQLIEGVSQES